MEPPKKIKFSFIKSSYYRVIHADGAHGGVTPRGTIFAAFYNERAPIPQRTVHAVKGDSLSTELREERIEKEGFVREVEVGIVMDVNTATALHKWLGDKIGELEKIRDRKPGEQTGNA